MQIYFPSLSAIEQHSTQLENSVCCHCQQTQCLVSHGYIYQKKTASEPVAVGKRVFCSNRYQHTGCGRTIQLYLDSTVRYLYYAGKIVVAFIFAFMSGLSVQKAYYSCTATQDPRNAYRWLRRFFAQLSVYRSLVHSAPLQSCDTPFSDDSFLWRSLFTSTMFALLQHFGESLCANFQAQLQRPFL